MGLHSKRYTKVGRRAIAYYHLYMVYLLGLIPRSEHAWFVKQIGHS